jgi:hypothetical protein
MNLVTIDTSPGNMSMYIAPNNTSYLQIGANASTIIIGPLNQSGTSNVSTVINGVRIDSHKTNNNLLVSFDNTSYKVGLGGGLENICNTVVSNWAFSKNTITSRHCTAVGHNCLTNISSGIFNTAIGADTLEDITTGGFNTALGGRALVSAITDSSNVAVGYEALASSVRSTFPNVAVGTSALKNTNNSLGGANVAVGHQALLTLTTGVGNVAIGYKADGGNQDSGGAMIGNTTGTNNIVIGNQANCQGSSSSVVIGAVANISSVALACVVLGYGAISNYPHCIVLGADAVANADNQIIIGKAGGAHTTWIQGSGGLNVPIGPASLANTTITKAVDDKAARIILNKNEYSNNTIAYDAAGGLMDVITTTDDKFGPTGNNSFAKAIMIKGANLNFSTQVGLSEWDKTGNGGNVLIRGGGSFSFGNNGAASQTLNGGNIYIDSGTAACAGGASNSVIANPGSIYLRCGRKSSGATYYSNIYDDKMTISPTLVNTTVPMKIYEAVGTGTITTTTSATTGLPVITDTMNATSGSLVIEHGNFGGSSSIVFPSANNKGSDFGYIRYRDDVNNAGSGNELSRLEIGVENDIGSGTHNDCLILNKNGANVGIGTNNPAYTLDVSGTARVSGKLTISNNIILPTPYISPTSGELGGITKGQFSTNTNLQNLTWKSTPAFTLSSGHYIASVIIVPKPGTDSNATFSNARITITDTALSSGTEKYSVYDPTTKPLISFGNLPYLAIYSYSTVFVNTASISLYLNFYPNFTQGGSNAPYLDQTDSVSFMRIA